MATATRAKTLYSVDDIERIQRDADRDYVERSIGAMKSRIPSIKDRADQTSAIQLMNYLDGLMNDGRVRDAAIVTFGVVAASKGRADEVLEVLRELAS